jgi:hypothetical protein
MPELLFGLMPSSTPEHARQPAPKTPSPLSDITNLENGNNHVTPRTYSNDSSMTPEVDDIIRAPSKPVSSISPEESSHKTEKLSRRQLKFENGHSLQAISKIEIKRVEPVENNPFCEKKENNFVPLMPQRNNRASGGGGGSEGDRKKRFEKDSTYTNQVKSAITTLLQSVALLYYYIILLFTPFTPYIITLHYIILSHRKLTARSLLRRKTCLCCTATT